MTEFIIAIIIPLLLASLFEILYSLFNKPKAIITDKPDFSRRAK